MVIGLIDREDEYVDLKLYKMYNDRLYGVSDNGHFIKLTVINQTTIGTTVSDHELINSLLVLPPYAVEFSTNRMLTSYIYNLNKIRKLNKLSENDLTQNVLCMCGNQVYTIDKIVVVKNIVYNINLSINNYIYSGVTIGGDNVYNLRIVPNSDYIELVDIIGKLDGDIFVNNYGDSYASTVYEDFNIKSIINLIKTGDINE